MAAPLNAIQFTLLPYDNARLAAVCGKFDENLRRIEHVLGVEINNRGNDFQIIGPPSAREKTQFVLTKLFEETAQKPTLNPHQVQLVLQSVEGGIHPVEAMAEITTIYTRQLQIKPRTKNQQHYVKNILENDINFGIGPSGTGKTYLAVACAAMALEQEAVKRIILVRPAVEAGEKLGFLPGAIAEKVDPYLRPLYDALYEMLGTEYVQTLVENNVIELAPLAYMRGRTLNDAFIILDESQNTSKEQMKMFLTRIGFGSKAVITGDITQIDLPKQVESGLRHATTILNNIAGIHFTFFKALDVIRHPLVQRIVQAYEKAESSKKPSSDEH